MFSHDCVGNFVSSTPRRDIRRGPGSRVISSRSTVLVLPDGGLRVSSGIDLATHVPAPTKLSRYPSASNCSYAFKTGMREIFSSAARFLVDGTRCPGRSWPRMMAFRNQSYSWRYIGAAL